MYTQSKLRKSVITAAVMVLVTVVGISFSGALTSQAATETTFQRIKATGVFTSGFFFEPPSAYIDQTTGKLTGDAPVVASVVLNKVFGKKLDMEGVLVSEFGSLIPGLQAGRFDIVASGLYIRKKRCEQVLFSDPQAIVHDALVVKRGNPLNLHSFENLRDTPNIKVGIAEGGSELDWARKIGVPDAKLFIVQNYEQAIAAFDAGRINVIAGPATAMQYRLQHVWRNTDKYELAAPFQDPVIAGKKTIAYYGTAFRLGDEDLRDAFNKVLDQMRSSGELLKIVEPFGFRKSDIPTTEKAADLCRTQE